MIYYIMYYNISHIYVLKKLPVKDVANSMDGASACIVFCRLSHCGFHWMSFHFCFPKFED